MDSDFQGPKRYTVQRATPRRPKKPPTVVVDLLDHPKLVNQLASLERRTARGGRDSIDHRPDAHDDVANAVSGVVSAIGSGRGDAWLNLIWD